MYPVELLTKSEKKVRLAWLICMSINILLALFGIGTSIAQPDISDTSTQSAVVTVLKACATLFYLGIFTFITYHCAYKNPGTKLLLWQAISWFFQPGALLKEFRDESGNIEWFGFAISTLFCFALVYICLRYRRINLRVKKEMIYSSPEFISALTRIQESCSLDTLEENYKNAILNRSRRFISSLKKAYKKKKIELVAS